MVLNTQVYNRNLTKGRKIKKKLHMGKETSLQPVIPQSHVSVPGYGCAEFCCIPLKASSADESHPIKLKTMNSRLYFTHPVSIQFESFMGNMATSHFIPTDVLHSQILPKFRKIVPSLCQFVPNLLVGLFLSQHPSLFLYFQESGFSEIPTKKELRFRTNKCIPNLIP